ncbi:hypothetical protein Tco_0623205 [Tanacetum coccineum]
MVIVSSTTTGGGGGGTTMDGDGRITGDDATKFFVLSNLDKSQLKQACRSGLLFLLQIFTIDSSSYKSNGLFTFMVTVLALAA